MTVSSILYGVGVGFFYSLKGWFSKTNSKSSDFNWKKLIKTLVIGGIIGGVASQFGMTFEAAQTSMESISILTALDVGVTVFINTVLKKIGLKL